MVRGTDSSSGGPGSSSSPLSDHLKWPNTVFQHTGVREHYLKTMYF